MPIMVKAPNDFGINHKRTSVMPKISIPAAGEAVPNSEAVPTIFRIVGKIEPPMTAVTDLLDAIALVSTNDDMEEGFSGPLQRLCWLAKDEVKKIGETYGELWRLTHPDRDYFEKTGWPGKGGKSDD
jgi:hypothetical protein